MDFVLRHCLFVAHQVKPSKFTILVLAVAVLFELDAVLSAHRIISAKCLFISVEERGEV